MTPVLFWDVNEKMNFAILKMDDDYVFNFVVLDAHLCLTLSAVHKL